MLRRFLSALFDLFILGTSAYMFYKFFPYDYTLIETSYYKTTLKANIFSFWLVIYFGVVPYLNEGQTLGDIIFKVNRFRKLEDKELTLFSNQPNPIIAIAKYFFHRLLILAMDLMLLSPFIYLYKKLLRNK
jgi:hypothetical protein